MSVLDGRILDLRENQQQDSKEKQNKRIKHHGDVRSQQAA